MTKPEDQTIAISPGPEAVRMAVDVLSSLPRDVLLEIFEHFNLTDILSIRLTSKFFNTFTRLRSVWHDFLTRRILAQNIPIHRQYQNHRSLQDVSAEDIENFTRRTLRAEANWQSYSPRRSRAISQKVGASKVFLLKFLKVENTFSLDDRNKKSCGSEEGRYILSFCFLHDSYICLRIWDLDSTVEGNIELVGEWIERGRVVHIAVDNGSISLNDQNEVPVGGVLIAVSLKLHLPDTSATKYATRVLAFNPNAGSEKLKHLKSFFFSTSVRVHAIQGSRLALQFNFEGGRIGSLKVFDWVNNGGVDQSLADAESESGILGALELVPSQFGSTSDIIQILFIHDCVLVFRIIAVEVYFCPSWLLSSPYGEIESITPLLTYRWIWHINSLALTERVSWNHTCAASKCTRCAGRGYVIGLMQKPCVCACRYQPISIVTRFDSYFPWPVNVVHHHVLLTNPMFDPEVLPVQSSMVQTGDSNCPYILPLQVAHIIPSSVRLFGRSDLTMGEYGTLVWIDSEADLWPNILQTPADEAYDPDTLTENTGLVAAPDVIDSSFAGDDVGERVAGWRLPISSAPLVREHGELKSSLMSAIEGGAKTQLMMFASQRNEGWNTIAVNERSRRVVVGNNSGGMEVWYYN